MTTDALLGILERSRLETLEGACEADVVFVHQRVYDVPGVHWVKMEHLAEFWDAFCFLLERRVGISCKSRLPHDNKSHIKRAAPTAEQIHRIRNLYADDIILYESLPKTDYRSPHNILIPSSHTLQIGKQVRPERQNNEHNDQDGDVGSVLHKFAK